MGPCHAGGPPARPEVAGTVRAHHTGRAHAQHGTVAGRGARQRSGTAEIDHGRGHGRAAGRLTLGELKRRWPAGSEATMVGADGARSRGWSGRSGARGRRAGGRRSAARWRRRRRNRAAPPRILLSSAQSMCSGEEKGQSL